MLLSARVTRLLVHLGAGLWAVLAGPMFKEKTGCIYNSDKDAFQTFGWHLLGGVAIFVWTGITVFLVLLVFVCSGVAKHRSPVGKCDQLYSWFC